MISCTFSALLLTAALVGCASTPTIAKRVALGDPRPRMHDRSLGEIVAIEVAFAGGGCHYRHMKFALISAVVIGAVACCLALAAFSLGWVGLTVVVVVGAITCYAVASILGIMAGTK